MSEQKRKTSNAAQRARRTRSHIHGTSRRPRLSVNISNKHVSAQIIDDDQGKTLLSATTVGSKNDKTTLTEQAKEIGITIAKNAKKIKVTHVALDRGDKKYHGRIKVLADAARENGLEF